MDRTDEPFTYQVDVPTRLTWAEALSWCGRTILAETLRLTHGNVSQTAVRLGLARTHCQRLLRVHGLKGVARQFRREHRAP